jgi:LacI family transcriptional regulator
VATIKDVAREAGVSVTTVSHVVNATRVVAPETHRRVSEVIRRLGYRPSGIAKALKANRTHAVGMLVTTSANPFFAEVIRGVEAGCFERGYTLILGNTGDVADKLDAYWQTLAARRIDGLVVMTTNAAPEFFRHLAQERALPVVALDTGEGFADCVINDDSDAGGRLVGRFLTGRGFRRIACISGPEGHPRCETRLAGFRAALAEAGQTIDPAAILHSDLTVEGGFAAFEALMAIGGGPPDAVFCFNDMLAMGVICAAHERGLSLPRDLSVIGYDDSGFAAFTAPPLTTVRQPAFAMGEAAAREVIEHLETGRPMARHLALEPRLVERRSVA